MIVHERKQEAEEMPDDDPSTAPETDADVAGTPRQGPPIPGLVVLHSPADAAHAGSWLPVPSSLGSAPLVLGRGPDGDGISRAVFVRQRPGESLPLPPLGSRALSRHQLELRRTPLGIEAVNVGRVPLAVNGIVTSKARLSLGDVVELGQQLVLLVCERPARLDGPSPDPRHPFGGVDPFGMVGESPQMWRLRGELARAARQSGHILVLGPSGSGKELAAAAIHGLAGSERPFVARNAATLPESLVDAELFGNAKGYPNPGMPERKGLVGEADGGTLFLDEIGDLPAVAQPHLLRVLDQGEYQRLGESRTRISRFRLIAATNRPESAVRHDLLARFDVRVRIPSLAERREDIVLLAIHLLGSAFGTAVDRFRSEGGLPRFGATYVRRLCAHALAANVRELRALLLASVQQSPADKLEWQGAIPELERIGSGGEDLEPTTIQAALDQNNGSIERTWSQLGLSSRHVLSRLVQKHGLVLTRRR